MTTSLQDLLVSKTQDEVLADELSYAQANGLPTTMWQSGSVIRTIFVVVAAVLAIFSELIAHPIKGGFGDLLSSLGWAKLWAKSTYDVDHVGAEPATGYITATNTKAFPYTLQAGALIVAHSTTGETYRNDADIVIPALDVLADIAITSSEIGTAADAAPGFITTIVGPSMNGVTVTNPLAVLGTDDETIPALVERSRSKLAALSPNGPKDAYNYVVKTPALCATASPITRATTYCDPATGEVTVYVANGGGTPSGGDITICQATIDTMAEPWCTTATAVAATTVTVAVTYQVWVRSSLPEADIQTAIASALASYFASAPIGGVIIPPATTGYIYVEALRVAIAGALFGDRSIGAELVDVTIPATDESIANSEVAVLGTVTPTVTYL